ncbi:MAG: DUF1565 domain-containing protein [Polyangiaceae bacterium]|nr:DUF1565 domain-containing protein [Polyangiaceae bacterium]
MTFRRVRLGRATLGALCASTIGLVTLGSSFTGCSQLAALASGSKRTLCVDVGYDGGKSDGSPERPYRKIQEAIDAAHEGDTIAVAQGRYEHGNIDIKGKGLTLLGGFEGGARGGKAGDFKTRDHAKTPTVVVGKRETGDYKRDPAAVFLYADSAGGKLDGFTITGGRHGIFTRYSGSAEPLVISNNIIEDNGIDTPNQDEYGGGIHTEYKKVVVEANLVRRNKSGRGAGMAIAGTGGDARVEKNVVENNITLGDHGGGIWVSQPAVVRGNVVRGNEVVGTIINWLGGVGGGIIVVDTTAELSDNLVTDNYAKKCGGGVFIDDGANVTMRHERIIKNRPAHKDGMGGSGIYVDGGGVKTTTLRIDFSTIAENAPGGPGRGNGIYATERAEVTVENSIFWNNGSTDDFNVDDTASAFIAASYSVWTGIGKGVRAGAGQLAKDPLFADPKSLDFHLRSSAGRWNPSAGAWTNDAAGSSPAIDAANPASPFADEPAPNGGRANLGFEGGTKEASRSGGTAPADSPPAVAAASAGPSSGGLETVTTANEPPAARGGCAGCAAAPGTSDARSAGLLVAMGLLATRLRRRR